MDKPKRGRPRSTMTEETIQQILRSVELGFHPDRAAEAAGIPKATMRAHKRRHPEFATALKKACARAEKNFLGRIIMHAEKQWTAAAWILERRFPERWKKREASDVEVKMRGKIETGPRAPENNELASYLEQLNSMPNLLRDRFRNN